MSRLLDLFDRETEGWHALLWIETEPGMMEEAPEGTRTDDPRLVRREQWIVDSDQYLFIERASPSEEWSPVTVGEHGDEDHECPKGGVILEIDQLLEMGRARLMDGESKVHPVLRDYVERVELVRRMMSAAMEVMEKTIGAETEEVCVGAVQEEMDRVIAEVQDDLAPEDRTKVLVSADPENPRLVNIRVVPVYRPQRINIRIVQ